jgi:hypothetical protein
MAVSPTKQKTKKLPELLPEETFVGKIKVTGSINRQNTTFSEVSMSAAQLRPRMSFSINFVLY